MNCLHDISMQELYTGGNDRQILVWSPSRLISDEMVYPIISLFSCYFIVCLECENKKIKN